MKRGNSYSYNHKDNTIGVWSLDVEEDLVGKTYQYQVQFPHHQTLTRDPYTIATSPDGKRSAILSHVESKLKTSRLSTVRRLLGAWKIHVRQLSVKCTFVI